jgi:hypothetical protein
VYTTGEQYGKFIEVYVNRQEEIIQHQPAVYGPRLNGRESRGRVGRKNGGSGGPGAGGTWHHPDDYDSKSFGAGDR